MILVGGDRGFAYQVSRAREIDRSVHRGLLKDNKHRRIICLDFFPI